MNINSTSWHLKSFSIFVATILLACLTPASAASNLQVSVNREIDAFLAPSKSRKPNSTAEKSQINNGMKKLCSEYNYVGIIGDTGKYIGSNLIKSTYKLLSTKRTNTRAGIEVAVNFTCSYTTNFRNIPVSNTYTIDFLRDSFGAGSIKSPDYSARDLSSANWRVFLSLQDTSKPTWFPKPLQQNSVFQLSLGSEGCVELNSGRTAKLIMYDPSDYFKGLYPPMDYIIHHTNRLKNTPVTMSDFLREDLGKFEDISPDSEWTSYSRGMYFFVDPAGNSYGKIVVVRYKGFEAPERFLISVLISPKCEIIETINLGKF